MLTSVVRLVEDGAGIEKTLRLFQSVFTILTGLALTATEAKQWNAGRLQLGLTRRYFRLLKWHPCFQKARSALEASTDRPVGSLLETAKWTLLGTYFFLEMFTITNAMGMTTFDWCPGLQNEANKFWFYGLVVSMLFSLYQILMPAQQPKSLAKARKHAAESVNEKSTDAPSGTAKTVLAVQPGQPVYTQLAVDACDILLPGSALGWIPVDMVVVGIGMTISTMLSGRLIWKRLEQHSDSR